MSLLKTALGALAGGAIGGAIWCAVGYGTGYEVGWIAWLVGVLAGIGTRYMAGDSEGFLPGAIAAVVAVLAVGGGKYAVVQLHVAKITSQFTTSAVSDNEAIVPIADSVAKEWMAQKKKLVWPAGKSLDDAVEPQDYPKGVWDEAAKRWAAMPKADQENRKKQIRRQHEELVSSLRGVIAGKASEGLFGPMDLLWGFLALASAFRIGSNSVTES